jgi:hypothetical protein
VKLVQLLDEHPDWYLREFAAVFGVWEQSVQKMFVKPGVTRKKKHSPILKSQRKNGKSI